MIYRISDIDLPSAWSRVLPRWLGEIIVGLAFVVVSVLIRLIINVLAPGAAPFVLLFPAALFATVLGGWRSGTVTAVLGGVLVWYFVLPPERSLTVASAADGVSLSLFSFAIALVILITEGFRKSARAIAADRAVLVESEARFHLVAENAPVNLWMGDAEGKCVYLNRSQRDFWGVPEDLAGFSWGSSLLPEDAEGLYAVFGKAMTERQPFEVEARYLRADGEVRILATRAQPRFDGAGAFLGMIGVNVDITESRKAETHQRLLLNELNHRVKNTLATVQSLALQSLRGSDSKVAGEVFNHRLLALSAAHDVLTRRNWEDAPVREIVKQAIRAYEDGDRFTLTGPPLRVDPKAALALAMALHELATNAVKYGALSAEAGKVAVTWTDEGDHLALEWRESGGPEVVAPSSRGFGSRMLAGLIGDLGEAPALAFEPTGVVCRFKAPVA
jgi:PAS domain S-box-containing protein